METLKNFKISENQKKFDTVELIYDELENQYIVRWKWTTMREPKQKIYNDYRGAYKHYCERKRFAISCN